MGTKTVIEYLEKSQDFRRVGLKKSFDFNFNFKKAEDEDDNDRIVEGYACTIHKDRQDDILTMEAILGCKDDLRKKGSNTVFLNHDYRMAIGKVVATTVDDSGLKVKIKISKASDVDNVWTKIKEGILKSMSIGGRFKKVQVDRDEEGRILAVRVLSMELYEVSIVGIPANPEAEILSVVGKMFDLKEKNMSEEKKEAEKTEISKTEPVVLTKEEVAQMISKNNETLIEQIKALLPKQEAKKEEVKQEEKKEEKKEEVPEWAKSLIAKVESISAVRKGFESTEGNKEEESEKEETVEKALVDVADAKTVKYVKHVMSNGEEYSKLTPEEKQKANSIYFVLLDKSTRKDS